MFTVAYYFSFFVFGLVMFVWEFSVGNAIPAACQFNVEFLSEIREWKLETDPDKRRLIEEMERHEYYDIEQKYFDLEDYDSQILSRLHNYLNFRIDILAFFRGPRISIVQPMGQSSFAKTFKALEVLPRVRLIEGLGYVNIDRDCLREYLRSLIKKRRFFWNRDQYCVTIEFWDSNMSKEDVQNILKEVDPRGESFQIIGDKFSENHFFLKTIKKKETKKRQSQQPSALAMPLTEKMGQELFHSQTGK